MHVPQVLQTGDYPGDLGIVLHVYRAEECGKSVVVHLSEKRRTVHFFVRGTVTPAKAIRRPELGTLSVGAEADVAVLRHLNVPASYIDCGQARCHSVVAS